MTPNTPPTAPPIAPRFGTWAFVLVAGLVVLDASPRVGVLAELADDIDPVMDMTGLWQGPWNLFAPDVDKVNVRVSAEIVFANGKQTAWRSPDWEQMSVWDRFVAFRHEEYVDSIRLDDNAGAWAPLARHLARTVVPRGAGPVLHVSLTRHWAEIPPPETHPLPARPYTEFKDSYMFFRWQPGKTP